MIEQLTDEWVIEKGSAYGLGEDWIGSEIYVNIGGEMAKICRINLILTKNEHLRLREIESERDQALDSHISDKKYWWQIIKTDNSETSWKTAHKKYMKDREDLYKRPKELHDKYLSIVLASQSAINLLEEYSVSGKIDTEKLDRVLAIAKGEIAPMFQYSGQLCSCGHLEQQHATKYKWCENQAECTAENCDCTRFEHATDIVGEIKTYNLKELREKENSE